MVEKRISLFDSIKGIAIIMIMFIHLGQWCLPLEENSNLATIRSAGLLGVELTYLVNAYFLTKTFKEKQIHGKNTIRYILRCFLKLIPVYYFGLIIYGLSMYIAYDTVGASWINVLSHFTFMNGLTPSWWGGYMGGTGYFGVLAIMWIVFPLYIGRIDNLNQATNGSIIVISISSTVIGILQFIIKDIENFYAWTWYINRGVYCYALGALLYYIIDKDIITDNKKMGSISIYSLLVFILYKLVRLGSGFDGLFFAIMCCLLICIVKSQKIWLIDNPLFVFLGRNITELFVSHIVLYYVLVEHHSVLKANPVTFFLLLILSIGVAPLLSLLISRPAGRIISRYFK